MPTETILGATRRTVLLDRRSLAAFGPGASVLGKLRVEGYHRIRGNFHTDAAPAVGFPRVRQSVDGVTFSRVSVLQRDLSQPGFQFPFDVEIRLPYVIVEYTQGGVGSTFIFARAEVVPTYGVGDDTTAGSAAGNLILVRSDKDLNFTGAILADDHETEDLTGLNGSVGVIESVTLLAEENLDWEVHFWGSDAFDDADLDADFWTDFVAFAAADAASIANAIPGTFRYAATGLSIPYQDRDATTELHVSLVPRGAAKTGGAAGEVVIEIGFRAQ